MGLDLVELCMDIEDEFGISIDDHDASRLETVGQVSDHVVILLKRNAAREALPCVTAHCFYEVRRTLLAERSVRPSRIRPDSAIDDLVPPSKRRRVLKRLMRKLDLSDGPWRFAARQVRDLVESYAQRVPLRFIAGERVDENAVWNTVCKIVLEHAPGDPARIKRDTHFVRDLHLD